MKRSKRELKNLNNLTSKGMKIRYLMDLLEKRNKEIRYLRKKLRLYRWDKGRIR